MPERGSALSNSFQPHTVSAATPSRNFIVVFDSHAGPFAVSEERGDLVEPV